MEQKQDLLNVTDGGSSKDTEKFFAEYQYKFMRTNLLRVPWMILIETLKETTVGESNDILVMLRNTCRMLKIALQTILEYNNQ